jgi:hypothetical protein
MSVGIGTIETFEFTPPEELEEVQYYDPFTFNEDGSVDLDLSGNLNVSGITTLGLGSTSSPQLNSQMSFELTNNATLTIRVKGTDGMIRVGIVTLS